MIVTKESSLGKTTGICFYIAIQTYVDPFETSFSANLSVFLYPREFSFMGTGHLPLLLTIRSVVLLDSGSIKVLLAAMWIY